jgi:hypothetical protein
MSFINRTQLLAYKAQGYKFYLYIKKDIKNNIIIKIYNSYFNKLYNNNYNY